MRTCSLLAVLALAAVLAAACGDSKSSMLPTAPTMVTAPDTVRTVGSAAQTFSSEAVVVSDEENAALGRGNDKDKDKDKNKGGPPTPPVPTPTPPGNTTPPGQVRPKFELEGLIAAVDQAARTLTVSGQVVSVPVGVPIRHGQTPIPFEALKVGNRVHVKATMEPSSSSPSVPSTLVASEVVVQNQHGDDDDDDDDDDDEAPPAGVTAMAADAAAAEAGLDPGSFRLTRNGTASLLAAPLTVTFTLTGTATNGVDYQLLPLTATFAAGQATVDVVVTPRADTLVEGAETVTLTLTSVAPYTLGTPSSATVTVADTPVVSVAALDWSASETGPDPGTFRFTRTGGVQGALTVTVTLSGTATNGVDYQMLPLTATFAAGQATVDVQVMPIPDSQVEASETVIVTLTDGAAYDVSTSDSAKVIISN